MDYNIIIPHDDNGEMDIDQPQDTIVTPSKLPKDGRPGLKDFNQEKTTG